MRRNVSFELGDVDRDRAEVGKIGEHPLAALKLFDIAANGADIALHFKDIAQVRRRVAKQLQQPLLLDLLVTDMRCKIVVILGNVLRVDVQVLKLANSRIFVRTSSNCELGTRMVHSPSRGDPGEPVMLV